MERDRVVDRPVNDVFVNVPSRSVASKPASIR
jgi:hypothetical protein